MTRSLNRPIELSDDDSPTARVIFSGAAPVPLSRGRSVLQWAIRHHLMTVKLDHDVAEERAAARDPHARNARFAHREAYLESACLARAMDHL